MTAVEAMRASRLLRTIADAQEWIDTMDEHGEADAFALGDCEIGEFDRMGQRQGYGDNSDFPIEAPLAREMFEWLIRRCDEELVGLGVNR